MLTHKTKKFDAAGAQILYINHFPLKYNVTGKLWEDHILAAEILTSSKSITAAVQRYGRNRNIVLSSWLKLSKETIINKAKDGVKIAAVYRGAQQMIVQIKAERRTMTLIPLTYTQAQNFAKRAKLYEVKIDREIHYLTATSEHNKVAINLKGGWNPMTGEVSLYHYEESDLPKNAEMLPQYLTWVCTDDDIPIRPATKA